MNMDNKNKEKKKILHKRGIYIAVLSLALLALSACKPTYGTNETPVMTTAAAEVDIPMDFEQIHNDVLESINPEDYPFVKNLNISGDNGSKIVDVQVEIVDNVSTEALSIFLDEVMKTIANEAFIQDFRYTKSSDTEYGSFFQKYAVHYTVTRGEETVEDITVNPGENFPFKA